MARDIEEAVVVQDLAQRGEERLAHRRRSPELREIQGRQPGAGVRKAHYSAAARRPPDAANAWSRSARMSSICSRPTDSRT